MSLMMRLPREERCCSIITSSFFFQPEHQATRSRLSNNIFYRSISHTSSQTSHSQELLAAVEMTSAAVCTRTTFQLARKITHHLERRGPCQPDKLAQGYSTPRSWACRAVCGGHVCAPCARPRCPAETHLRARQRSPPAPGTDPGASCAPPAAAPPPSPPWTCRSSCSRRDSRRTNTQIEID